MKEEESLHNAGNSDKNKFIFLKQLVQTLEDAELKMEQAYKNKDYENFNKIKKFMIEIQKKIEEITK